MATNRSAVPIPKEAFISSIAALLALTIVAVASRFLIRLHLRRRDRRSAHQPNHHIHYHHPQQRRRPRLFGVDDAFLLVGLACATAATSLILRHVDQLYRVGLFSIGLDSDADGSTAGSATSPDSVVLHAPASASAPASAAATAAASAAAAKILHFHKCLVVGGELVWLALCAVKFSFLFFFCRLIRRQPGRVGAWWWAVLAFTVYATLCMAVLSPLACPYYNDFAKLATCSRGPMLRRARILYSVGTLNDVVSDILILTFPERIIWQIRTRWPQKLALACSLCLTVLLVALSAVRAAGPTMRDPAWDWFWTLVACHVALILTASTALRALFVAHSNKHNYNNSGGHHSNGIHHADVPSLVASPSARGKLPVVTAAAGAATLVAGDGSETVADRSSGVDGEAADMGSQLLRPPASLWLSLSLTPSTASSDITLCADSQSLSGRRDSTNEGCFDNETGGATMGAAGRRSAAAYTWRRAAL